MSCEAGVLGRSAKAGRHGWLAAGACFERGTAGEWPGAVVWLLAAARDLLWRMHEPRMSAVLHSSA